MDGGTALGAEVSAHFDSMLVKLTCRGRTFEAAVARAQRAVAEFRIRGVATNLPFLQAVLADPDFRAGHVTTSFIEERPQLLTSHTSGDRGTKILDLSRRRDSEQAPRAQAVGGVSERQTSRHRPEHPGTVGIASAPPRTRARTGSPRRYAPRKRWRSPTPPSATRHQSLLATRVRTSGCSVSPATSHD